MCPFGIIGGTNLIHSSVFSDMKKKKMSTRYGDVEFFDSKENNTLFIPRHGIQNPLPPHRVNHHANITALREKGVKHVLGITSVGSLKEKIMPGSFVIPQDFLQLSGIETFFHDKINHITPTLDNQLRKDIHKIGKENNFPVQMGGIYIQTSGPRFETAAEINFYSNFGELIGMNMASEATLTKELDMSYANLSVVDNYGNGITGEITYENFMEKVRLHQKKFDKFLNILVPELQKIFK